MVDRRPVDDTVRRTDVDVEELESERTEPVKSEQTTRVERR